MTHTIHPTADLGEGTTVGHYTVILERVRIGRDCRIGHHVIIHADTVVGEGCVIDDHAVLGKPPLRSAAMAIAPGTDLPPLQLDGEVLVGTGAILFRGSRIGARTLIADLASVRENASIGRETVIGRNVAVENHVVIGDRCKVEAGVFVCAYSTIADDCFVAPEVAFTNDNYLGRTEERKKHYKGVTLERGARVGANATVLPGKTVHQEAVAGAGAVVTRDVPGGKVALGSPARERLPG
jgi:acetyltransferase-like isoleucine patch superfamily enzyme